MRLIDAGALIAEMHNTTLEDGDDRSIFYAVIERQPTIDPVKHGRWVMQGTAYGCSLCGEGVIHPFHNYCPNCGARMTEGGEDDDRDTD